MIILKPDKNNILEWNIQSCKTFFEIYYQAETYFINLLKGLIVLFQLFVTTG